MTVIESHGDPVPSYRGDVLVLDQAISFWGGIDPDTGRVVDDSQGCFDEVVTDRVLVTNGIKGSTASPGTLLELITSIYKPAGIISSQFEPVIFAAFSMSKIMKPHMTTTTPFYRYLNCVVVETGFTKIAIENDEIELLRE